MASSRLFVEWLALLLATALLVFVANEQGWAQRIDAKLLDETSAWRLSEPSDEILLVEIDDRSLAQIGNWPWDRTHHAKLLRSLSEVSTSTIVYDVLFFEPTESESDKEFADAIAKAGNVVLAHSFGPKDGTINEVAPLLPLPIIRDAAKSIGHVAVFPDEDGVVRRFSMTIDAEQRTWPHIGLSALQTAKGDNVASPWVGEIPIIPMHPIGSFQKISASDVISGTTPSSIFQDRIVLVGATAQGLGDRYSVSENAGRIMPGVEIQANLLSALLQAEVIYSVPASGTQAVTLLAIVVLFAALWKLPPALAWRISLGTIFALILLSAFLLIFFGFWLPVSSAIFGILLAYPVWGWRRLSAVSRFLATEANRLASTETVQDDQVEGFDIVARQVAMLKSLVGETRDRLTFLSKVLAISPDPMLVFDSNKRLLMLNEKAEMLFGKEASNKNLTFLDLCVDARASYDREKEELAFLDGTVFLVATSSDEDSPNDRIFALRDVTKERASANERSVMLEFLSHDMRSPQVAIVGLATGTGLSLEERERFSRIEEQARRTLKLTDDFVQIARLENSGINPVETDIGALLYEAADRAYPAASRKAIKLQNDIPDAPEFCNVDPSAISRAIDNLIGNAIKFADVGTVVSTELKRSNENSIQIEISDEGPGLPQERLADPFARFGAHNSKAGPSAGLGLAYVKRVVDEHGGTISVHSEPESGTRFTLVIPCGHEPCC